MLTLLFLSLAFVAETTPIKAVVGMENPHQHYYQIEMAFPADAAGKRLLQMPVWTPGSYSVRDYARNVERFKATDMEGNPLPWVKVDKTTWQVTVPPKAAFKISYLVFAYEFTVRTSYLDNVMGFINPASVFFYERGKKDVPFEIEVVPQGDWSSVSGLDRLGPNKYKARDLDHLIDSPLQFGDLRRHDFEVRGIPHAWVITGDLNMNEPQMVASMQTIGEVVSDIFGAFPFNEYFILSQFSLEQARGGLEHLNSTMVHGVSDQYRDKENWDRFLGLIIHEYFHAWNVKAIRDTVLGPFDYQKENYTRLLWLHEGWTSYYDELLMARAGFWNDKDLSKAWAKSIESYQERPGVEEESLSDASFDAWIHYYRRDQKNSRNAYTDYYQGGALSGLCLDLLIRNKTKNQHGLDTVMRRLYNDYARQDKGINREVLETVLRGLIGEAGPNFLATYIDQAKPLPLETSLAYAGVELKFEDPDEKKKPESGDNAENKEGKAEAKPHAPNPKVTLGVTTRGENGTVRVSSVPRGKNGWAAGFDFDDEILAINDRRVTEGNYAKNLAWYMPGDEVRVLVSRNNKLIELNVRLEEMPKKLKLVRREDATELQRDIYQTVFQGGAGKAKPSQNP